ncbi:MAG: sulfatase-like hydrolase/transferase [Deltaproteobacteria bacterium]|nr:sulfatase-like hydrolase/transferase [Deltaproteobacteria bacterium]
MSVRRSALEGALAGLITAAVLGPIDALFALHQRTQSLGDSLSTVVTTTAMFVLPSTVFGALVWVTLYGLVPRKLAARIVSGALLGALTGWLWGLALFSGTSMMRSSRRPWLLAAATVIALAVGILLGKLLPQINTLRRRFPRSTWLGLSAASLGMVTANALLWVRRYVALHQLLSISGVLFAVLACACVVSRSRPRRWTGVLLMAASLLSMAVTVRSMNSQRIRALLRQHAPMSQHLTRTLGLLLKRSAGSGFSLDDRPMSGRPLELEGLDMVIVTVDALRLDRLGAYGSRANLTPALDRIASEGVVVERAYCTTPHTSYSLASIMTGKYFRGVATLRGGLQPQQTIAGLLRDRGYRSAAFFPSAVFSVDGDRLGALRDRGFDFDHREEDFSTANDRAAHAEAWLRTQAPSQRVLLWVHLFEPHESYERHPGARVVGGASAESRYDAEVAAVDDAIGSLERSLTRTGRRAVWVITADHGEEFGEHGGRFHGTTLYDEQVRVPLIVRIPGFSPRRVSGPASHIDLLPTLIAGVGQPIPPRVRGRDLGPLLRGEPWDRVAYASVNSERMVLSMPHKLLCDVIEGSCELFNLRLDPSERSNLADSQRETLDRLRPLIAGWDASHARYELLGLQNVTQDSAPLPPEIERVVQGDRGAAVAAARLIDTLDAPRAARAVEALGTLGDRDPAVLDALARAQERHAIALALEASIALARLGDPRGRTRTLEALSMPGESRRRRAAHGLAVLGDPAGLPILHTWLFDRSASDDERDSLVTVLDSLRNRRSLDVWIRLFADPRLAPRAATALEALRDPRAIAPLEALAIRTPYALTRNASLHALAVLGAPRAAELFRQSLVMDPPLSDPFAIEDVLTANDSLLRHGSIVPANSQHRTTIRFAPLGRPSRIWLRLESPQACAVRVDNLAPLAIPAGVSIRSIDVERLRSTVVLLGCAELVVSRALAAQR